MLPSQRYFPAQSRQISMAQLYPVAKVTFTACLLMLCGCATPHKPPHKAEKPVAVQKPPSQTAMSADGSVKGEIIGVPVPGSRFSQLQIGMKLQQVEQLIGRPNRTDSRVTGKHYQPFYFGGDTQRTEAFYKGEGRLTFSNIHPDDAADTLIIIRFDQTP